MLTALIASCVLHQTLFFAPTKKIFTEVAFQIAAPPASQPPAVRPPIVLAPSAPHGTPEATDSAPVSAVPIARSHFHMANGYGHAVPLVFAVRQIVPSAVHVSYGPSINPAALVTWTGGREWNKVLASTVAQIGARIEVGRNSVTILQK